MALKAIGALTTKELETLFRAAQKEAEFEKKEYGETDPELTECLQVLMIVLGANGVRVRM